MDDVVGMHDYPKVCIKPASATSGVASGVAKPEKNPSDNQRIKCQV